MWRGIDEAAEADERLTRGDAAGALAHARRAAALSPRDAEIATLYLAAAERANDLGEQRAALERLVDLVEPGAPHLIRLAYLCLATGDAARAAELARRGRVLLPRRFAGRKGWLSLLEYVETASATRDAAAGRTARRCSWRGGDHTRCGASERLAGREARERRHPRR